MNKYYAMYKGDTFIDLGTVKELSKKHNIKIKTLYWLATAKRIDRSGRTKRKYLIPIEEGEDNED